MSGKDCQYPAIRCRWNGHLRALYVKIQEENRIARLVDSPNLPDGEAAFNMTTEGVKD